MGASYTIKIRCANCEFLEEDVYYAPSSGSMSFTCSKCKKLNWVSMSFVARIVSKKEEKQLYKAEGFR